MTRKDKEELKEMMVLTFNDGFEQVVMPRLEEMEERIDKKIKQSEERVKKELREEFRKGQQSLSSTLEEVSRKVDAIAEGQKEDRKRLDRLERIVKVN